MPSVKTPPPFVTKLRKALVDSLMAHGVNAKVSVQAVPTTKLYRVFVRAEQFKHMRHSERQSVVWRIADSALSPEDQMRISMILTLTDDEAGAT